MDQGYLHGSRRVDLLSVACALGLVLAAVVSPAAAQDSNAPLRFGSVNTLSGPVQWPQSSETVQAYFESINANGGIRGRRLELMVEDDKGDPAEAARAARRLIDKQGVLAMVGSASIVDCASNAELYQRSRVVSLQGTGIEPECFTSSHVVPVNTGPYLSARNGLQFARDVFKAARPCAVLLDIPGTRAAYDAVISGWSREQGVQLVMVERYGPGTDMKALVKQAQASRCDAVVHTGVEPHVLEWLGAVQQLGVLAQVPAIFLTPAYTERVAAELKNSKLNVYAMAEFEPWSSRSLSLMDWRALLQRAKLPTSSFSQGGYVSAQVLVRALRSIDGEITRESVSAALRSVERMELAMLGVPFSIGAQNRHNPNRATLPMKLDQGVWRIASAFWVVAP